MDLGIKNYGKSGQKSFSKPNDIDHYPITKWDAEKIASDYRNLITDYDKRTKNTMNVMFDSFDTKAVCINGRVYWMVQVLSATTYDCIPAREDMNFFERLIFRPSRFDMVDVDGAIDDEEDLKLLRCLIDAQTGEYIYYPKKFFEK